MMKNKSIGGLEAALLLGVAAGVLALSAQATAGMHSGTGMHSGASSQSVSAPPPHMSPPSSGMQTPMGHPMGWRDRDHDHDHDHDHHRRHFDDDDFFFFDPFWWDYPYTVETQYVEVPASDGYWYYCPDSRSYYPYVRECASKWERVPPQPPPQ